MRVLFLVKYGRLAASSRYRFLQYLPFLESQGFRCFVSPLLDDVYLTTKFNTGRARFGTVLRGFLGRARAVWTANRYDLVVLNYEAFPFLPAFFEKALLRRAVPYVYDYDDAIFHNYDQHPSKVVRRLLGTKLRKVIAGARCVVAGNRYLADYAAAVNRSVHVVPTVIDLERYPCAPRPQENVGPFTIGWIGSPPTSSYLKPLEATLAAFCASHDARLVLIGSGPQCPLAVPKLELRRWSEETEVEDLRHLDVGIMPVPDSPWARGKCGFKLIQYMACGLPVIASPIGVNAEIVEHGVNGFLASTPEEWLRALTVLHDNQGLRRAMGDAGRKKVETTYCLQVTAPRLAALFEQAAPFASPTRRRVGLPPRPAIMKNT